jgi:hypothetical protein
VSKTENPCHYWILEVQYPRYVPTDPKLKPKLKANLVRLQKGQIKVRDPPNEQEWEVIWYNYTKRESA